MMTKAEYILADAIILQFPIGQQFFTIDYYANAVQKANLKEKLNPEMYQEVMLLVNSRTGSVRDFLLENEYIKQVDFIYSKDELTEIGKSARNAGGHQQYLKWVEAEAKQKAFEDFPKKKWIIYEPVKAIVILLIGALLASPLAYLKGKADGNDNSRIPNQDHFPKLPLVDTAQVKPKTLDKIDTP